MANEINPNKQMFYTYRNRGTHKTRPKHGRITVTWNMIEEVCVDVCLHGCMRRMDGHGKMVTEIQKGIKISDGVSAIRKYANAKAVRESIQKKRK